MCGIAGFIDVHANYDITNVAEKMGHAIYHRGPDSSGIWSDKECGVNLIHRRLAILDLSAAGHQPMFSESGRYIIVFNGEIYNFKAILVEIEAKIGKVILRGHSDTEVILLAIETFGLCAALSKFEGMFALALWDRETQTLSIARDRVGEKPLYYGYFNGVFAFSSELAAIKKHPKFINDIDRNALGQLMLHNCIPAPVSIYSAIKKLSAGSYIQLSLSDYHQQILPEIKHYWQLSEHVLPNSYTGSFTDAVNDLDNLLSNKIADQMIADVPLGCFLSGGVDSSTIAALMQKQSAKPIKTFSIGFDNPEYNEAEFAKEVARHLGTEHHELYVTEKDALAVVDKLANIYSEPFADSSQIPTFLVSQMAREHVTVCLSGDGGDELFAGYNRYLHAPKLFAKANKIPKILRGGLLHLLPLVNSNNLAMLNKLIKLPITNLDDKIYKLEMLLKAQDFRDFYLGLTSHWIQHNQLVIGDSNTTSLWDKYSQIKDPILLMQYLDTLGYMADDILVKVDRAAMASSLETRVPLLNHKIVEFAFSLPHEYKITNDSSKHVLRQLLYKYVPSHLIERPKRGFAIPLNKWLRGELKDWACDLLSEDTLKAQGYFDHKLIKDKLSAHLSGRQNNGYLLWDVLMFQNWLSSNSASN